MGNRSIGTDSKQSYQIGESFRGKSNRTFVDPQKNDEAQVAGEKKPNLVLRANLIKWAIIFQATFLNSSATHIHAYLKNLDDKVYLGLIIFDLIMLVICSTWMTSNHRFETDRKQGRRNVNIELCYCIVQAIVALLIIYFGFGLIGSIAIITVGLIYILYINPKFMSRKLTK